MKVASINFVAIGTVPKPVKNTELSQVVGELVEAIKKAPAGQAVSFKLDSAKRWTTYALKRALLQRHNLDCQLVNRDGTIYILLKTGKAVPAKK